MTNMNFGRRRPFCTLPCRLQRRGENRAIRRCRFLICSRSGEDGTFSSTICG